MLVTVVVCVALTLLVLLDEALAAALADAAVLVQDGDVAGFVNHGLDAVERERQEFDVVGRECDVDEAQRHDDPGRDGERPPPVRVVGDAERVEERAGQVGPEDVHEEGERGGQVQYETIVFVGGDFWGRWGEGSGATGRSGDLGFRVVGCVEI